MRSYSFVARCSSRSRSPTVHTAGRAPKPGSSPQMSSSMKSRSSLAGTMKNALAPYFL